MSTDHTNSLSRLDFPLDRNGSMFTYYQALEHPDDGVHEPSWDVALRQLLQDKWLFGIVSCQADTSLDPHELWNPRIACVSPRSNRQMRWFLEHEHRVFRQIRARYARLEMRQDLQETPQQLCVSDGDVALGGLDIHKHAVFQERPGGAWISPVAQLLGARLSAIIASWCFGERSW